MQFGPNIEAQCADQERKDAEAQLHHERELDKERLRVLDQQASEQWWNENGLQIVCTIATALLVCIIAPYWRAVLEILCSVVVVAIILVAIVSGLSNK